MKNFQNKAIDPNFKVPQNQVPLVTEYMTKDLITFLLDDDINDVIKILLDHKISGAAVLDESGDVVGLIDDKDCLGVLFTNVYNQLPGGKETVRDYMTSVMKTISTRENIIDVAHIFVSSPYKRLLIVDDNKRLVGQISRQDILRAIKELR